nr:unnamed protein product [Digitaria exilis]
MCVKFRSTWAGECCESCANSGLPSISFRKWEKMFRGFGEDRLSVSSASPSTATTRSILT